MKNNIDEYNIDLIKISVRRRFAEHLMAGMPHIGKTEIVPEQLLSDAKLRDFVSTSQDKYGFTMFSLLRAVEIGGDYLPNKAAITELAGSLIHELGSYEFAVQIIRYHIAAEMQCVIHDGANADAAVVCALESLSKYSSPPLMAEINIDTAYKLWSRVGSWSGVLESAGLMHFIKRADRRKVIARYRAENASPELLPETVRLNLTPAAMHTLTMICNMANKAGRLLYDFEFPYNATETFRLCGYTLWELPRLVGLTAPTDKASPEIKEAVKARNK